MNLFPSSLWLSAVVLLLTTGPLPAPIQEVPESPTPAREQSEPNASRTAKPKVKTENAESSAKQQRTSLPAQSQHSRFPGAWHGTMALGIAGNLHLTLVVNSDGTSVTESGGLVGTITFKATNDGKMVTWHSGLVGEITWTLNPNPDGQTALVTAKGPFIGNPSATFTRGPTSPVKTSSTNRSSPNKSASERVPTGSSTSQTEIPTAKPVPNKPGFVYNPFDSKVVLDVKGKASGMKVKDPASGKLFIVP